MVEFYGDWAALSGLVIIILLGIFVIAFLLVDMIDSRKIKLKK